jgi:hypothetical protein
MPKLITLCGSTKFKVAFEEWNVRLTMEGAVVLSIVIPSHSYGLTWTTEQKQMLDKMHLAKIDLYLMKSSSLMWAATSVRALRARLLTRKRQARVFGICRPSILVGWKPTRYTPNLE